MLSRISSIKHSRGDTLIADGIEYKVISCLENYEGKYHILALPKDIPEDDGQDCSNIKDYAHNQWVISAILYTGDNHGDIEELFWDVVCMGQVSISDDSITYYHYDNEISLELIPGDIVIKSDIGHLVATMDANMFFAYFKEYR